MVARVSGNSFEPYRNINSMWAEAQVGAIKTQKEKYMQNTPTFIDFVLDETGSMSKQPTIEGFNDFIKEQKELPDECYMTLTKFNSLGVKTPYDKLSIGSVPPLSFLPDGCTNLYDVVGQRLSTPFTGKRMFVVLTDGADNSSREFNQQSISILISNARENGVKMMYLGSDANAKVTAIGMGFQENEIIIFKQGEVYAAMNTVSHATKAYRTTGV